MERNWLLGDDLAACDNLLDGITLDDKEVDDLLKLRLADMRELLERNIDKIAKEARKGRE